MGDTLALKLDALNLMQCVCRKVAFPAIWAGHNRYVFDHQEFPAFAITPGNLPDHCVLTSTDIANHDKPR